MSQVILNQCEREVKKVYEAFDGSHDWHHIERVMQNAKAILKNEKADPFLVMLSVLLHDVSDVKYRKNGEDLETIILEGLDISEKTRTEVKQIIQAVSFSGGNEKEAETIEAAIVRDADRLDAIGAIGIARTFAYGGAKSRKLYDPEEKPREKMTEAEYRSKQTASVTHFHEKLLLLKDRMLTETGKRMAEERHAFMVSFLQQLQNELDGKA